MEDGQRNADSITIDAIPREVHSFLGHIALMEKNIDNAIIEYHKELKHFEDPKHV